MMDRPDEPEIHAKGHGARPRVLGISLRTDVGLRLRRLAAGNDWEYVEMSAPVVIATGVSTEVAVIIVPQTEHQVLMRLFDEKDAIPVPTIVLTVQQRGRRDGQLPPADRYLPDTADDTALTDAIRDLLSAKDSIEFAMHRLDSQAQRVAQDENIEWFRCRFGIVGVTRVTDANDVADLSARLALAVRKAYGRLDDLPEDQLSLEDLWNVLLFIAVPWTQEDGERRPEILAVVDETARDTSGSRKIILWKGHSLLQYLGPIGKRGTLWLPSSPDPLRDALGAAVRDEGERKALEVLFKARISEIDLDRIVETLGKRPS